MFERLRAILHEGEIDKRVQFMIEGLFAIRKAGFAKSGFPAIQSELDLVEEDDQITHEVTLDEELNPEMQLDVFKFDDAYEQHEEDYEKIKKEILGECILTCLSYPWSRRQPLSAISYSMISYVGAFNC